MASAGMNVPAGAGAGAGGDGVGNTTAAAPECLTTRRGRRDEPRRQGSGGEQQAAGPSWVRRLRPAASRFSPSSSSASASQGSSQDDADDHQDVQEMELAPLHPAVAGPQPPVAAQEAWPMAFGKVSVAGRMRNMEDTVSLHPNLCTWAVDGSPMHFFAVFDGHGGPHVSAMCRERMHELVAEELEKEGAAFLRRREVSSDAARSVLPMFLGGPHPDDAAEEAEAEPWSEQAEEERAWRAALMRSFRRADAMAALACACGRVTSPKCRCPLSAAADADTRRSYGVIGSTAVVAVLVRGRLIVANCGDSRAVLCQGPRGTPPVPLSFDHKPNRPDEMARIQRAGGRVLFNNGYRVRGILAMSRAIGDRLLREVIAEPEITITERTVEDQCLILASDGMWDVMDNDIACDVARQCLEDGMTPAAAAAAARRAARAAGGQQEERRCLRAASLLARLALGRGSQDNISIIVVDLKHRE